MACGCESYTCVEVMVNPCLESVNLGILAEADEAVTGMIEFNGNYTTFSVAVNEGQNIFLPVELFNEQYVHELRLTQSETLCYKVKTLLSTRNQSPIIDNSMWNWARITGIPPATMVVEDSRLTGDISPEIWLNGEGFDFASLGLTQVAGGVDFSAIGGHPGGIFSFQYRNIPV